MQNIKIRCRGVIVHEGKILLVRHAHGAEFYALPGGHLDFGEDPLECMKRELIEELGIAPEIGRLLYVYSFVNNENIQSLEFFFEIKNVQEYVHFETQERTHAYEIDEVVWMSPTENLHILPEVFGKAFRENTVFEEGVRFIKG